MEENKFTEALLDDIEEKQAEEQRLTTAFARLMGENGDQFVTEILNTGELSASSYRIICNNVFFNGRNSIVDHFGIVHWYYLKRKNKYS